MNKVIFNHENLEIKIKDWNEIFTREKEPFVKYSEWFGDTSIKVDEIRGTQHPSYIDSTYNEFLATGRRMKNNQLLYLTHPIYYDETIPKIPSMFFQRIKNNSDIYVQADGNHRTAIAKLHKELTGQNILHGVNLYQYTIDEEFYCVYEQLKKRYKYISASNKLIAREDEVGYKKDIYEIFLIINGVTYTEEQSYNLLKHPRSFTSKLRSLIHQALKEIK